MWKSKKKRQAHHSDEKLCAVCAEKSLLCSHAASRFLVSMKKKNLHSFYSEYGYGARCSVHHILFPFYSGLISERVAANGMLRCGTHQGLRSCKLR